MRTLGSILAAAVVLAACTPGGERAEPGPTRAPEPPRPNILVVVTDDMRPDGLDAMPFTVEWLIEGGRNFTDAYATTPLCCPSRASIFTGRYAHNHGVLKNRDSHDLDTDQTVMAYLREQTGYRTALVGKYLNSWSVEEDPPNFDVWTSYSGRYYGKPFNVNGTTTSTDDYSTHHMAERSTKFLRSFERDDDDPWFLYVATVAPHAPFTVAPEHKAQDVPLLNRGAAPAPSLNEVDLTDKPDIPARPFSLEKTRKLRKKQWRTLLSVDDMMRKLRGTLSRLEEEEDTLVIFTSDQGILQGEHGLFAKRLPYTEAIRVPLLVRWPGRVQPGVDERLVANVDIAPTIMEVAGVIPEEPVDGVSLLSDVEREGLFIEQLENWRVGLADWRSFRTADAQYVEYYNRKGSVIDREYYDLAADPFQMRNLLGDTDTANDPDVELWSSWIEQLRRCEGEDCVMTR